MTITQTVGGRRRMGRKQRRIIIIAAAGAVLVAAVALVLTALSSHIVFFNSPADILANPPSPEQRIRLGGLVENGTFVAVGDGVYEFNVTDGAQNVPVTYQGILPDLFREGQGVITEGTLGTDGVFRADTVLAKHDQNYMPAEVVNALKEQGEWHGDDAPATATQ
jgi:cytochrome c-type biogenesis protein CcmE